MLCKEEMAMMTRELGCDFGVGLEPNEERCGGRSSKRFRDWKQFCAVDGYMNNQFRSPVETVSQKAIVVT